MSDKPSWDDIIVRLSERIGEIDKRIARTETALHLVIGALLNDNHLLVAQAELILLDETDHDLTEEEFADALAFREAAIKREASE